VTETYTRERCTGGPIGEGGKICHIVERDDPDTALSGQEVRGYPWNPPWPVWVICVDRCWRRWGPSRYPLNRGLPARPEFTAPSDQDQAQRQPPPHWSPRPKMAG
jgi:hypothetical protein